MKSDDYEVYGYRKRRPWLLLIVLGVLAVVYLRRYVGTREQAEPASIEAPILDEPGSRPAEPVRGEPRPEGQATTADIDWARQVNRAQQAEREDRLVDARQLYQGILERCRDPMIRKRVEELAGDVNVKLALSPRPMPEKHVVIVERGDSLARIAKKFGTTVDLIQVSNRIDNPNLIKAGDRLLVLDATFDILVSKSRNDLVLRMNGGFFKRYPAGTGRFGKTPVGAFTINDKIKEPVWWRRDGKEVPYGDPENILGTRWMSLRPTEGTTLVGSGYGIHGTWDNSTIGKAESAGCIRMKNSDVEELFILVPLGTSVTISE